MDAQACPLVTLHPHDSTLLALLLAFHYHVDADLLHPLTEVLEITT